MNTVLWPSFKYDFQNMVPSVLRQQPAWVVGRSGFSGEGGEAAKEQEREIQGAGAADAWEVHAGEARAAAPTVKLRALVVSFICGNLPFGKT